MTLAENILVLKFVPWIRALRIYQWAKNMLLFLALFMSHRIFETQLLKQTIIAFLSFSLCASAVYILNDLFDLEADRKHPSKKNRPLASGQISVISGKLAIPILLLAGFLLSIMFLPMTFTVALIIYLTMTTSYTLYLKEKLFIDVIVLGTLYTLRVLAGGLSTGIEVSSWLLGFSWFFFLSLAFMKRYTDLLLIKNTNQEVLLGRGYSIVNLAIVQKTGIVSGVISLIILALYINSGQVMILYKNPFLIWLALPILFYWLLHMWAVARHGNMTDDPIIYAFKDISSYIAFLIIIVIMIVAANITFSL